MLAVLAAPSQFDCRLIKHVLGLSCDEVQDRLCSLDDLNVSALAKDDFENFVLLQPQTHQLSSHVTSDRQLLRVDILHVPVIVSHAFVILVSFDNSVDHQPYVLQTFDPLLQIG